MEELAHCDKKADHGRWELRNKGDGLLPLAWGNRRSFAEAGVSCGIKKTSGTRGKEFGSTVLKAKRP